VVKCAYQSSQSRDQASTLFRYLFTYSVLLHPFFYPAITGNAFLSTYGMVSILEFKSRSIERLTEFCANAHALPRLTHARYLPQTDLSVPGAKPVRYKPFAQRTHKPHQMHTQHRNSCVALFKLLIHRLDIATRECLFVNPKRKIRRPLYVPEMARETSLADRTVQRCLASLVRSGYLIRTGNRYFLSLTFFRDLRLDISYLRLQKQLVGLSKKASLNDIKPQKVLSHKNTSCSNAQHTEPNQSVLTPNVARTRAESVRNTAIREACLDLMPARIRKRLKSRPPP